MTPICPKCGREIIYIASPSVRDGNVYIVDAKEKRLITKMGRVTTGYKEHICAKPDKAAGGADV
jgi:hypothetical protein